MRAVLLTVFAVGCGGGELKPLTGCDPRTHPLPALSKQLLPRGEYGVGHGLPGGFRRVFSADEHRWGSGEAQVLERKGRLFDQHSHFGELSQDESLLMSHEDLEQYESTVTTILNADR